MEASRYKKKETAMTETTKTVFETHEVRKTKRQKAAFRAYATEVATREGYAVHEEKGAFGAVNLVIGDPTRARVTYTAHYDTCARLPFPNFITPKHIWIYLAYQVLLVIGILGLAVVLEVGTGHTLTLLGVSWEITRLVGRLVYAGTLFAELFVIMAGPANPHTANDNTSGVTTVLELLCAMPEELRGEVAFILFDLEEMGLFGSSGYAGQHKAAMKDKLLINFDCVSDGDTILFAVRKGAVDATPALTEAFPAEGRIKVDIATKGVFYPSDQAQFPRGVGVAALKTSKGGILYMNRIHTKEDTVYDEGNIAYLVEGSIRLARGLSTSPTC